MITWREYVKSFMESRVKECGGTRRAARKYKLDPSVISRIINEVYVPSRTSMKKWFSEHDIPEVIAIIKE